MWIAALLIVLGLAACGSGDPPPRPAEQPLRIYSSLPASDPDGHGREDVGLAVRLAFEERGARAGPHRVQHVALDSGSRDLGLIWEVGAITGNARKAVGDQRAVAYIGEIASGASAVSMPLLNKARIVQVAPSGAYAGLTRPGLGEPEEPARYQPSDIPTFARVAPADHLQAEAQVASMRILRTGRLIVVEDGEFYATGVARTVDRLARSAGIEVVAHVTIDPHRLATIRDAAERARRGRADTMLFAGVWQNRAVALWGRMHRAVPRMRLIGGDGVAERAFTEGILESARERTYLTRPDLPRAGLTPQGRSFADRFKRRYRHEPAADAIFGFEAARLVLDSLAAVPAGRPDDVRRALLDEIFATRNRPSVLGRYSIDRYGDTTLRRYGGYRVSGVGALVFERVLTGGG